MRQRRLFTGNRHPLRVGARTLMATSRRTRNMRRPDILRSSHTVMQGLRPQTEPSLTGRMRLSPRNPDMPGPSLGP
ncbi:hypothetical protein [Maritimibacter sp. DP1N21-5]|uniref:hypothetical protein n=1 Tax=Maritimibacter sp. DP1N21-5 TaxID=2836867 RepID=UPI001C440AD5|nr:hypothetical protein [Maritimibacter sp. DP1N21-5]MBV7409952.1 hypothetical protein [Maritimibacter sp. DP1N21-5]